MTVSTDVVHVDVFVEAPQEVAFELFTRDIDLWWRRGPAYRTSSRATLHFEPRVGGRFLDVHADNGTAREIGVIRVWRPPLQLVFDWRGVNYAPGERTEVDVSFAPADGGTRVTVTHRGLDNLPPEHPARHGHDTARFLQLMSRWWADLLTAYQTSSRS